MCPLLLPVACGVSNWRLIALRVTVSHCSHSRGFWGSWSAWSRKSPQAGQLTPGAPRDLPLADHMPIQQAVHRTDIAFGERLTHLGLGAPVLLGRESTVTHCPGQRVDLGTRIRCSWAGPLSGHGPRTGSQAASSGLHMAYGHLARDL
jgi:hypothetical protein